MEHQSASYVVQVTEDTDETKTQMDPFSDLIIRRGFIRKVFFLLTFQLIATAALICLFIFCIPIKVWVLLNPWFTYALIPALLVLIIMLACFEDARRKVPLNFILLFIFTVVEGLMLGATSVFYHADEVVWTIAGTALVTWSLSLFALQTKFDFTGFFAIPWTFLLVLFLYGILFFFLHPKLLHLIYSALGTLFFSLDLPRNPQVDDIMKDVQELDEKKYLMLDIQLMLRGRHRYYLSPEDYIFATLNLYLDVINIFIFALQLISQDH